MQCPLCNVEAAIAKSRYKIEGDKSPDVETKLYIEQEMTCRNPNCSNYGTLIDTVKNELQLSKDTSDTTEEAEMSNDEEQSNETDSTEQEESTDKTAESDAE